MNPEGKKTSGNDELKGHCGKDPSTYLPFGLHMRSIIVLLALLQAHLTVGQRASVVKEHWRAFRGLTPEIIERKKIDPAEVEHLAIYEFADSIFTGREIEPYHNLTSLYLHGRPVQLGKRDQVQPAMQLKLDTAVLRSLSNLRHLIITQFDLREFPDELFQFTQLQGLTMILCNMESLPSEISKLSELEVLDLTFNYLSDLPVALAELKSLEVLTLTHNHFRTIPSTVIDIQGLRRLALDNPFGGEVNKWGRRWPYPICDNHIDWETDTTTLRIVLGNSHMERVMLPRDECGDPMYFNRAFSSQRWSKKVRWDMKPSPCPDPWPDRAFKRFPVPYKDQIDRGKCLCGLRGY